MKFDPNKPCVLSDGLAVRILATNLSEPAPIGALIFGKQGQEVFMRFRSEGRAWEDGDRHLVNVERAHYSVMRSNLGVLYVVDVPAAPSPMLLTGAPPATRLGDIVLTYLDGKLTAEVKQ